MLSLPPKIYANAASGSPGKPPVFMLGRSEFPSPRRSPEIFQRVCPKASATASGETHLIASSDDSLRMYIRPSL
jgi:hypothetical protein